MALNPIVFTESVVRSFLRYQLTAYPFADERLHTQMRKLLSLDETRQSPLFRGPYVSLSRPFRQGAAVDALISEGVFHPMMRQRIPAEITHVYGHQEQAIRSIHAGHTTLVSTGTGSGKTECFLYPIVSKCLALNDEGAPAGISAVIVYPMNALAEDQLGRLRSLLAGTGVSFGMYVGKTPENEAAVTGVRMPVGASRAEYEARLAQVRQEQRSETVHPAEEICSREVMRTPGRQPRILLTNVKQLELLLTRQRDVTLFADARLDFLVFDEAHTFTGAQGAETACLIRRLRAFCDRKENKTVCVATSATIVDPGAPDAAREFASRFFGVPKESVATVGEAYEPEVWASGRTTPVAPATDANLLLSECVKAVEADDGGTAVRAVFKKLARTALPDGPWPEALHAALSKNEIAFQLTTALVQARRLSELPAALEPALGRVLTEPEILAWLTLGAAARADGRPLVRPVVHGFVRGISGAVVSFDDGSSMPQLWLAAEDELAAAGPESKRAHFPITTCTTCGQHYFIAYLKDFEFSGARPSGGQASGDESFWEPLAEPLGGKRVVLMDAIVGGAEDDDLEDHDRLSPIHFCRRCGAAHGKATNRCLQCGTVGETLVLHAVRQKEDNPGVLSSCLCCTANGRRLGTNYREPARPVRATNVADVHVLAQDMVHHSERPRLLIFCDNRQDAAFQAGWMKDHARRFRLRALMAGGLSNNPMSVGDLSLHLDDILNKDESLSRALVPEVWQVVRREGGGGRHEEERRKFLRIQVLREVTLSSRQAIGLEPWGRMKVEYLGLDAGLPWIQKNALGLKMPAEDLREGVASLLDYLRRKRVLHDPEREIFGKYWMDGDLEIQQGYLPQLGSPTGTKLRRGGGEKPELVTQWLSTGGETTVIQMAKKWGVSPDDCDAFLEGLFAFLLKQELLVPVKLKGSRGTPLPGLTGLYQVNADRLRLQQNHGVWRCRSCRRRTTRRTPKLACSAWRCHGQIEFIQEDPDNYDLQLLDQGYSMIRPEEHTAMVPHDERERLENLFKGESDAINAFVCTPTLELGVDIGQLDAILMRNVPPLPANYWQRAGRAGRRHRMAVNLTYCRAVSHDRAYFAEPVKLLSGRVDPPAFNLRNDLMVAKHVHAAVITRLHWLARQAGTPEADRIEIEETLKTCIPSTVTAYLFEDGDLRTAPFDLGRLRRLIERYSADLSTYVAGAFKDGWPVADVDVVRPETLRTHISEMVANLDQVVGRLARRLHWAMDQIRRLNIIRDRQGTLDPEDDALFKRCDMVVRKLRGTLPRTRRDAEGYDDVNTFGVLAAEGFLPGYGLDVGSVVGSAEIPFWRTGAMAFDLPRASSVALREYVPGNLIYANGHKFVARRFHRDAREETADMPVFEISTQRQAAKQIATGDVPGGLGSTVLKTIAVCDVDLVHQSHISDEEDLRFQMGVATYGLERDQHNGGRAYKWGEQSLHRRRGVRLRLVNVGSSSAIARLQRFGYPICAVCGYSISPVSSERQHEQFETSHKDRCGRVVEPLGFYADVVADVLSLPACPNQKTAYSVLEALRFAAATVLDMHMDDLQVLVVGHVDRDEVDGLLWDPMPGGSGLIDQICARFDEIAKVAKEVVDDCPSLCGSSCVDCLQTFRNGYYHAQLDRLLASEKLETWGGSISVSHDIQAKQPSSPPAEGTHPVNEAERRLRHLLLAAGFEEGVRGKQIRLDPAIGTTTPDIIYKASHHGDQEGICIYLDGLGGHLHGNPGTATKDQLIRGWLRNNGYEVIEIAVSELHDAGAMVKHFRKLAGYLGDLGRREAVATDPSWFARADAAKGGARGTLRLVEPRHEDKFSTCVPVLPFSIAAGDFGERMESSEWVEVRGRTLSKGMFVARVDGYSMEPLIPNGAYCLFEDSVAGSRQGRNVLVELTDRKDPETGQRFTVKRYESEKTTAEDGTWRHTKILLKPLNPAYAPIELTAEDEGTVRVVAVFVEVVSP